MSDDPAFSKCAKKKKKKTGQTLYIVYCDQFCHPNILSNIKLLSSSDCVNLELFINNLEIIINKTAAAFKAFKCLI